MFLILKPVATVKHVHIYIKLSIFRNSIFSKEKKVDFKKLVKKIPRSASWLIMS